MPWYQSTCEMSLRAKTAQWPSTHNVICVDCTQTQLRIIVRRIPFRKNPYMTRSTASTARNPSVSYTHLDVYKRQSVVSARRCSGPLWRRPCSTGTSSRRFTPCRSRSRTISSPCCALIFHSFRGAYWGLMLPQFQ